MAYGLSVEPMLGDVVLPPEYLNLKRRGWVIAGGEKGKNSVKIRPTPIEWFRRLRDQCIDSDLAFFFKQWGNHCNLIPFGNKHSAGRILDGRTWDEYPVPDMFAGVTTLEQFYRRLASLDSTGTIGS